jgi:hypothetical protein
MGMVRVLFAKKSSVSEAPWTAEALLPLSPRQPCCPALCVGELRRRDLQSLSEITSPKALDEKRPVSGRGRLIYREVG